MSRFPDTPAGWAVLLGFAAAIIGAERLAVHWGWLKPDKDVNPGWAYARSQMFTFAVCAGGLLVYFLLFDRN